eukprot:scaffold803_cov310-Pinguiococcus_pyrenoidosus.AAC.29
MLTRSPVTWQLLINQMDPTRAECPDCTGVGLGDKVELRPFHEVLNEELPGVVLRQSALIDGRDGVDVCPPRKTDRHARLAACRAAAAQQLAQNQHLRTDTIRAFGHCLGQRAHFFGSRGDKRRATRLCSAETHAFASRKAQELKRSSAVSHDRRRRSAPDVASASPLSPRAS